MSVALLLVGVCLRADLGGAIHQCNGLLEGNVFIGNHAGYGGGAISHSDGIIRRNYFAENVADQAGGAIAFCNGGEIVQNIFIANSSDRGGAIEDSDSSIQANIFYLNTATTKGGALYWCPSPRIEHNTFYGNTAQGTSMGGAIHDCDSGTMRNNIIWGNSNPQMAGTNEAPTYSFIDATTDPNPGNNNIGPFTSNNDPGFVTGFADPSDLGTFLHLDGDSPCIDVGQTSMTTVAPILPIAYRDIDDHVAPLDGNGDLSVLRDMGADKYSTLESVSFTFWWEFVHALLDAVP